MPPTTPPELVRSDISLFILQLKALGVDNVLRFDWMDSPPSEMMIRAMEFLYSLKAIDDSGRLTKPLGTSMAEVPVDPMMAAIVSQPGDFVAASKMSTDNQHLPQLLNSHHFRCGEEILSIAAMTSVQNVFVFGEGAAGAMGEIERRKFTAEEGVSWAHLGAYGFNR